MIHLALAGAFLLALGQSPTRPSEFEAQRKPSFTTGGSVLIRNGRLLTVTQGFLDGADILVRDGRIAAIGKNLTVPTGVKVIDATGKFVTPGLVDAHSHRGADDINEADTVSAEVRMTDVLNPDQDSLYHAVASGITTGLLLHGSANPIGGQSVVIKHKWKARPDQVIFPGAPRMIKFALGENVKQSGWQDREPRFPATRQGVEATYRRAFTDARDYMKRWDAYEKHRNDPKVALPRRDLRLETLADILKGKIHVQCHSYRQDEIMMMVRLSQEFGFNLTLQHALEAYKVAPELAAAKIPVSIFGDGYAYKLEVIDSMPMASTILDRAGVLVSVNTDTGDGVAPLNLDAAKAMRYGTSPERALRMITINPAMELGIQDRVGSLEVGKDGDLAIWDGHPLSTYAKCTMTFIEGEPIFERRDAFKVDKRSMATSAVAAKPFDPDANPLPPAAKGYLIVGATVHPISGPEQKNSTVLIENGKIVAVGAKVEMGPGTVRVDGKGLHVWPGLIDAGSQLGLIEIGQVPSATDERENGDFQPDLRSANAVNPESIQFPKVRYNGVTEALVYGSAGVVSGQSGIVKTLGTTVAGMRIEELAGLDVMVPEGIPAQYRAYFSPEEIEKREASLKEQRAKLRAYFESAKRYLEARNAGDSRTTDTKLDAFAPYLEGKKPVLFHAGNEEAIRWSVKFAKSMGLKGVLMGGAEAWKVASLLKENGFAVVATPPAGECPSADTPGEFDPYDTPMAQASVLADAGVRFAFASNGWETAMNLPYRVGRMCAFGLSHDAAMRALTLDAAKIFGIDDRYGSLEPGKIANVIVTDGDPLEVTTRLRYIFIDGQPVPLESRYTDLYRKYMGRVSGTGGVPGRRK